MLKILFLLAALLPLLADAKPEEGFEAVPPDLEDVYFGQLHHATASKAA